MRLNPLSWFTDIGEKYDIPVWHVWLDAIVLGYLVLHFLGIVP